MALHRQRSADKTSLMDIDFLTPSQAWLLEKLVKFQQCGELIEPFIPLPVGTAHYVIYLRTLEGLQFRWLSDLDVLCLHQFLSYKWNRMSTAKAYQVTTLAHTVIDGSPSQAGQENSALSAKVEPYTPLQNLNDRLSIAEPSVIQILRSIVPKRDFEDAQNLVNQIESATNQADFNKKQVIQQLHYLLRYTQNFLQIPKTLAEVEQQADFYVIFGSWQKTIVDRLSR